MAWYAPCAEYRVCAECVHSHPTIASMKNADGESYAKSDAHTECVVVDKSADSVDGDAVQLGARLRTRSRLETGQTMLVK